jgi:threonine/homoserine/homoserine lactone efflux protein
VVEAGVLLQGVAVGLSIAAPVGPIGVLCIRRTLSEGRLAGLVSGLGAATADAVYGCIAAFGLSLVTELLVGQEVWLRLVGGLLLCILGVKTLFSPAAREAAQVRGTGLVGAYASTFALTLTNPMTVLSFAAILSGLGVAEKNTGAAALLVLGVLLGSALWWLMLSTLVSLVKGCLSLRALSWINRLSGTVILAFGLYSLWGVVWP